MNDFDEQPRSGDGRDHHLGLPHHQEDRKGGVVAVAAARATFRSSTISDFSDPQPEARALEKNSLAY